jgi:membrane dipeptidase
MLPAVDYKMVLRHIDHVAKLVGPDHVGLGSDFDGTAAVPAGLEDVSLLPRLGDALTARGLTSRVVDKVFAGNWIRVLDVM